MWKSLGQKGQKVQQLDHGLSAREAEEDVGQK